MKKLIMILVVTAMVLGCWGCGDQAAPSLVPAPVPTAAAAVWPVPDWQASIPESQGVDSGKLAEMLAAVQAQELNVHSILIARNGTLVLEAYADPYTAQMRHTVESNTKSIVGTLIGIAIQQGLIKSVDEKLVDFFPQRIIDHLDARKKAITLRDLLSLQAGLDCADRSPSASGMYQTKVWVQYLLDLPVTSEPGTKWEYCSGAVHLLSAVLQQAAGVDARTFANQNLFAPLGIRPAEENDWATDPQGVSNGIAGLYLTPRELAKYGLLYLRQGKWDGMQVVPAAWVAESTREQAYIGKDEYVGGLDRRFGYLFSLFPEQKVYGYLGMAGQEMFVLPEQNGLVVFTAGLEAGEEAALLKLLNEYIVPAMQSTGQLPADAGKAARLESGLRAFHGVQQQAGTLPQTALDISGRKYLLGDNPFGWADMAFYFQPGSAEATIQMTGSPELKIGLDGLFRLTEIPKSRPQGLKGRWESADTLVVEDISAGEFGWTTVRAMFAGDKVTLTAQNRNFGGDPIVVSGDSR